MWGISRKTYYYWHKKDHPWLSNHNYRFPKRQPNTKLTYPVRKFIEEQKLITNYGPLKMKLLVKRRFNLDVSTTIIYRYYRKRGLIRKPQRKTPWYKPMKQKVLASKPGEAVQIDVKYVWEKQRRRYQFSVYDPFTCKYHFTIFDTKESKNAITAFLNAEKYFGFKILSVQIDNGSEFRSVFHDWLVKHNLRHYFIPKHSPYWNAQVERVHKTIDDEFYLNPHRVWKSTEEWLHYYNYERIHLTLKGLTPHEKYLESVTKRC
jgi:transposase InsO family protein